MQATKYIWYNNQWVPWKKATAHVLTHGLHYGTGVFEGIRAYETDDGPAIFSLTQHLTRMCYSAKQLNMAIPYSEQEMEEAVIATVAKNKMGACYIRPLVFYGYGELRIVPQADHPIDIIIACWPWGGYLGTDLISIKTSDYIRIHPKSSHVDAKISGHYVNSLLANIAIKGMDYQETLLLDVDGYVSECSADNIFFVKDGVIVTTPLGTILPGITRRTIIDIAKYLDIPVEERLFRVDEIYDADECFVCGTAVEITGVGALDDKQISDGKIGEITKRMQTFYGEVVRGRQADFRDKLTYINKK